jgi:hypothetical protein
MSADPALPDLDLALRAIGLLVGEIKKRAEACERSERTNRADAKKFFKEGHIAAALDSDKSAAGAERTARELQAILWRFKTWQGHGDTPNDQLPFPL